MEPDWASLPSHLLGHIADCLLATNDVDCYMDFRAVCTRWRSAAEDPKSNPTDIRFQPRHWILVDEVFQTDARLMINTATGRVLRKDLPLLRRYEVTATTPWCFFVLADLEPPHTACVLNPLTGHMIPFMAPVPFEVGISAAAFSGGSPAELVLLSDSSYEQYMAVPDSKDFNQAVLAQGVFPFLYTRLAVAGGFRTIGMRGWVPPYGLRLSSKVLHVLEQFSIDGSKLFSYENSTGFTDLPGTGHSNSNHCFLVECAGQPSFVIMQQGRFQVFSVDTAGAYQLEAVRNIGDQAVFVGYRRSISVSAQKFPSIAANCIYYVKSTDSSLDIYRYNLETEQEERVSEAIDSLKPSTLSFASPPFTIIQLLSSYTINAPESQLAVEWHIEWKNRWKNLEGSQMTCYDYESFLAAYSDTDIDFHE